MWCWHLASLPRQGCAHLSPHLDEAIQSALVELRAAHDRPLVHHPRPHHIHGVGGDGPRQPTREAGTVHTKSGQGQPEPTAGSSGHWQPCKGPRCCPGDTDLEASPGSAQPSHQSKHFFGKEGGRARPRRDHRAASLPLHGGSSAPHPHPKANGSTAASAAEEWECEVKKDFGVLCQPCPEQADCNTCSGSCQLCVCSSLKALTAGAARRQGLARATHRDLLPGSYQGTDVGQQHFCHQPAETKLAFHVTKGFLPSPSPRSLWDVGKD